jgi:hypothetical protein
MATDHQHHHSSHGDDGSGPLNHETTDISLEGIGKLTIGFALVLFVVTAVIYGTYILLDARAVAGDSTAERAADLGRTKSITRPTLLNTPNGIDQMGRPPAGPKLLTNEPLWLADIKKTQQEALTTYGWVSKEAGTVRLPIDRAKALIVERGLPTAAAGPADGTTAPAADAGGVEATVGTPVPTTTPQSTTAGSGPRHGM